MSSQEEEKYFQQQEAERRKEAQYQAELAALNAKDAEEVAKILGIEDQNLALRLVEMGFGPGTVAVFPLIPLVYVAWADGEVTESERERILDIAKLRGADEDHEGYAFLKQIISHHPKEEFFDTCIHTLRAIFNNMPADKAEASRQDLISMSVSVADASGGFLGLFGAKVSQEEQELINEIIRELKLDQSDSASTLLGKV